MCNAGASPAFRALGTGHTLLSLLDKTIELHGDRATGDDPALHAGLAWLGQRRCVFLGTEESAVSAIGARRCTRLLGVADLLKVPVVVLGTLPLVYERMPLDQPSAVHAHAELFDVLLAASVPTIAVLGSSSADAVGVLHPFDLVVHSGGSVDGLRDALASALDEASGIDLDGLVERRLERAGAALESV